MFSIISLMVHCNKEVLLKKTVTMGDEKKMKSGVLNLGSLYEEVVAAYFALELVKDSDVTNFNIKLNPSSYQKFDDIVINIEHKEGETEKLALQLKHREKKREQLDVKEFDRKGKGFEITQYLTAFNKLNSKVQNSYKFIIYTNAEFININDYNNNNCYIKPVTNAFKTSLFNVGKTLQLKNKGHSSKKFFEKFFLISEQKNYNSLKDTIITIFNGDFYAKETDSLQYLEYFGNLRRNFYNNEIDMNEVILKLLDILSADVLIKIPTKKEVNKKLQLLEKAFKMFDISLVQVNVDSFKQYKMNIIKNNDNIKPYKNKSIKDKLLPLTEKPLYVATDENSQQKIYQLIKLSQSLKELKVNLVLVGKNNVIREKFKTLSVFSKLSDLKKISVPLYEEISATFKVSLQGRKLETIKTLRDTFEIDLDDTLGPNELIQALYDQMTIGTKIHPLPEDFIKRHLIREKIIAPEELPKICKKNETVVHCNGSLNHFKSYITSCNIGVNVVDVKNYNPNMTYQKPVLILSSEKACKKEHKCYHHLKVDTENNLTWRITTLNLNLPEIFDNQLSIIAEDPGFGKTTIMNFLANECPLNYWVINAPLKQLSEFLKKSATTENFFKNFITKTNNIDYKIIMELNKKKKWMIFFDGLNELCDDGIQLTIDVVKQLLEEDCKCWISCTRRLEDILKKCLEPFVVYEIEELTEEEQRKFIHSRIKNEKMTKEAVDDIEEKLLNPNEIGLDKYILKSPLCLHILTETLKKLDINILKEQLNNAQLYSLFIDGTLQHKLEEAHYDERRTNLKKVIKMYKKIYIKECQTGALKACLETEHYEMLKVSNNSIFLEEVRENGDFMDIIIKINADDTFVFTHYSFSEYFAALWLFENFKKISPKERRFLYKFDYLGIRYFLNPMLAQNCPLHLAVHNRNFLKVQCLVNEYFNNLDEGGRTALHVASSLGVKHLVSKNGTILRVETFKTGDEMKILKHLINTEGINILEEDTMFRWNCFQYADASLSLSFLEELLKKAELQRNYLNNYSNLSKLGEACVKYGYITILKKVIEWETLEKLDTGTKPFLHLAIDNDQTEIATLLINHQVDLKKIDLREQTALHLAAFRNNTSIASQLLQKDVDVEAKNSDGSTPLHFAARMGHTEIVKMLVEQKADINARDRNGRTPLDESAYMGRMEILQYFVENKANVNSFDNNNKTAVQRAASMEHYEIVKFLIDNKADLNVINAEKCTLLHYAVLDRNLDIVKYLIDKEINIFARNADGKTAHELAQHKNYEEIAEILKSAEQDKRLQQWEDNSKKLHKIVKTRNLEKIEELLHLEANSEEKESVLHVAVLEGDIELVKYLIQKGANRNRQDHNGQNPLHLACEKGDIDIVKEVITKENMNATDRWDLTSLHRAAYKGHLEVVKILIKNGASILPNRTKEETALHSAVRGGHHNIIDYMCEKGLNIWTTNGKKETSLHIATRKGKIKTINYLLAKSLDKINAVDSSGKTALHLAAEKDYPQLTECLIKAGINQQIRDIERQTALDVAVRYNRKCNTALLFRNKSRPRRSRSNELF